MKADFIIKFIQAVGQFADALPYIFRRESMYYKDLRMGGFDPEKIYAGMRNLQSRKIIQRKGHDQFMFTTKGRLWFMNNSRRYFRTKYPRWDKKWRIVIFDIPEEKRTARIRFRHRLKYLGFYPLQKSVFVFPYACEEELGLICQQLRITTYVDILIAQFPGFREQELKKIFVL